MLMSLRWNRYGFLHSGTKVSLTTGGGTFVFPIIEQTRSMSLGLGFLTTNKNKVKPAAGGVAAPVFIACLGAVHF